MKRRGGDSNFRGAQNAAAPALCNWFKVDGRNIWSDYITFSAHARALVPASVERIAYYFHILLHSLSLRCAIVSVRSRQQQTHARTLAHTTKKKNANAAIFEIDTDCVRGAFTLYASVCVLGGYVHVSTHNLFTYPTVRACVCESAHPRWQTSRRRCCCCCCGCFICTLV